MNKWTYFPLKNGVPTKRGPISESELQQLFQSGQLACDTKVVHKDKTHNKPQPASDVEAFRPFIPTEHATPRNPQPKAQPATMAVRVVDIDMPIESMAIFIFKWTLASIPSVIVLSAIAFVVFMLLAPLLSS